MSSVVHRACKLLSRLTGFCALWWTGKSQLCNYQPFLYEFPPWPVSGTQPWAQTLTKLQHSVKLGLLSEMFLHPRVASFKRFASCIASLRLVLKNTEYIISPFSWLSQILLCTSAFIYIIHTILVQIPDCFFPSFPSLRCHKPSHSQSEDVIDDRVDDKQWRWIRAWSVLKGMASLLAGRCMWYSFDCHQWPGFASFLNSLFQWWNQSMRWNQSSAR